MRTVHWLFVVSVLLFVSGIGFVIAAARTTRAAAPVEVTVTTPVADITQIMNGITGPSAKVIYDSVGTIVGADIKEIAPQNDQEWAAVADSAAALAESGNLLLMPGRAVDTGDWTKMAQAMIDAAKTALTAAEQHNADGILEAGSNINDTCDSCHAKYQRQ